MNWGQPLLLSICLLAVPTHSLWAQGDLPTARSAFQNGDCQGTRDAYQRAAKSEPLTGLDHDQYLDCLYRLEEFDQADRYLRAAISDEPDRVELLADRYHVQNEWLNSRRSKKTLAELLIETRENYPKAQRVGDRLIERKAYTSAKRYLTAYRDRTRQPNAMSPQFAKAVWGLGDRDAFWEEQLEYLKDEPGSADQKLASLQQPLAESGDFETVERKLLIRQQRESGESFWVLALGWLYVQQSRFSEAFAQYRALDRRFADQGPTLLGLAEMAQANGQTETAIEVADYVADTYRSGTLAQSAAGLKISLREAQLLEKYPVAAREVEKLIADYQKLINGERDLVRRSQYQLRVAELRGRYLGQIDEARAELTALQNNGRVRLEEKAEARLLLGDLDLIAGEPWEAALRYAQVEKDFHQHPLGYEAKLRGARLAYYRGDFDLARAHLRVLKEATSRRMANDALELYLLVSDHAIADSAVGALPIFARTDLQLYLHQDKAALATLDSLQNAIGAHPLQDDIRWRRARILERMGRLDEAQAIYQELADQFSQDLFGDDALLALGKLLEEKRGDPKGAMAAYKRLLIEHPGSSLGAEARRRYRALRGDILN